MDTNGATAAAETFCTEKAKTQHQSQRLGARARIDFWHLTYRRRAYTLLVRRLTLTELCEDRSLVGGGVRHRVD